MTTGRFQLFAAATLLGALVAGTMSGCAQSGPIASHRNTVGSLKASVSQLEYANEGLKKQVADLKSETSRADSELAQAQEAKDEMAARLDDAKNVIRSQGGDVTALTPPSGTASRASTASAEDDLPPPAKTSPIRRSSRGRKSPTTAIPKVNSSPDTGPGALELPAEPLDPGPQASRDVDDGRWLPVARGRSRGSSVEIR